MSLSLLFHILVITKWHTKEIIADGSRRSFNFQGELSRYRFTFKQLKDIHAGPESPTSPTSNSGSTHLLPSEIIHQPAYLIQTQKYIWAFFARPPDLRRHSNGLPDRAKTYSLSKSRGSVCAFSNMHTNTHDHTRACAFTVPVCDKCYSP